VRIRLHRFSLLVVVFAAITAAHAQSGTAKPVAKAAKTNFGADPVLIDLAGYNQVLAKYSGKPLMVTFWATWCEPCRAEYPMLVSLAKQYEPQGLAVFGVSLDDDADMNLVHHFLTQNRPDFPNYRQKPGIDVDDFYHGVNPDWQGTMPQTVFYRKDGHIAGYFVGDQTREDFEKAIHSILASPDAAKR